MKPTAHIERLIRKGVSIPNPLSVEIGEEVSIDRISARGVMIHSGSKIYGRDTYISQGAQIGYEGPATIENCQLGADVALKGGFYQEAVFLEGAQCGLGSHVRKGTILEEQASIAHTVGLKQTILFPFVTLGSLINFCDCLMAGGTSRKDHSEVGSSYVHFNYTPSQDKATPSIMGDVPRGVMLNQSPIFLGGQGGLVGPCRLAYGTVVAAGTVCRKDQLKENHLIMESGPPTARLPHKKGGYRNLKRLLRQNLNYIGNLYALKQWYTHIRQLFLNDRFEPVLLEGLLMNAQKAIDERVKQLGRLRNKVENPNQKSGMVETAFFSNWDHIKDRLHSSLAFEGHLEHRDSFCNMICAIIAAEGKNYIRVIQGLDGQQSQKGVLWLQGIVDHLRNEITPLLEII